MALGCTAAYESADYRVKVTVTGIAGGAAFATVYKTVVSPGGAQTFDLAVRAATATPPGIPTQVFYDYELDSGWTHTYHAQTDTATASSSAVVPPFPARLVVKDPMRPFLNTAVTVQDVGPVTRQSRGGLFYVVGQNLPVARTSVRGGRQLTLSVLTTSTEEFDALDASLSTGDVLYLDPPEDIPTRLPSYVQVDSYTETRAGRLDADRKLFELNLVEVEPPDFAIGGVQLTWTGVVASFATWAAVVAANATWQDVLDNTSDPNEVIV